MCFDQDAKLADQARATMRRLPMLHLRCLTRTNVPFPGRPAAASGVVVLVMLGLAACGESNVPPSAGPQAAAGQTADAAVRRLSSGNFPPTPTPAGTPAPRPSCPDAVWWHEAGEHLGERRTVQGAVVHTRTLAGTNPPPVALDLGQSYPDPSGLQVLLRDAAGTSPEQTYAGKTVCVTGLIRREGTVPVVAVDSPAAIAVLN